MWLCLVVFARKTYIIIVCYHNQIAPFLSNSNLMSNLVGWQLLRHRLTHTPPPYQWIWQQQYLSQPSMFSSQVKDTLHSGTSISDWQQPNGEESNNHPNHWSQPFFIVSRNSSLYRSLWIIFIVLAYIYTWNMNIRKGIHQSPPPKYFIIITWIHSFFNTNRNKLD